MIYPDSKFKVSFDLLISALLMITCILTPLYVAFPSLFTREIQILDNTMNGIFMIEIILNFFYVFYDEDFIIIDDSKVSKCFSNLSPYSKLR